MTFFFSFLLLRTVSDLFFQSSSSRSCSSATTQPRQILRVQQFSVQFHARELCSVHHHHTRHGQLQWHLFHGRSLVTDYGRSLYSACQQACVDQSFSELARK